MAPQVGPEGKLSAFIQKFLLDKAWQARLNVPHAARAIVLQEIGITGAAPELNRVLDLYFRNDPFKQEDVKLVANELGDTTVPTVAPLN